MTDNMVLASRWRRLVATGIDAALVPALSLVLVATFGVVEDAEDFADSAWMLHVLLLAIASYLLLNGWLLWQRGQTIGKRVMGIAIAGTGADSQIVKAPLWRLVLLRAWFFALLFGAVYLPVGIAVLLDHAFIFSRHRRALHDLLCRTVVVDAKYLQQSE